MCIRDRYQRRVRGGLVADMPMTLDRLGELILNNPGLKIGFLTGAGASCAAGIPDFRSPGGMYDSLRPELLTASDQDRKAMVMNPTSVVTWDLFSHNPLPYHEVRRPFILGTQQRQWKATTSQFLARCLHDRGLLRRVFTQNIDGLDYQTGVPSDKLVACHGSIAYPTCELCGVSPDPEPYFAQVRSQIKDIYGLDDEAPPESTPILCPSCAQPGIKPSTVLFGRNLPPAFFECSESDAQALDVLIVIGTSLAVFPAAGLVSAVRDDCIRVVINKDPVGQELGIRYGQDSTRDLFLQGDADTGVLELLRVVGWLPDLEPFMGDMCEASQSALQAALSRPTP
eukprot:TRINITY_DN55946_c0_g1_i1.p1 TRINITY_DN55946_c0_g1~~TRINITY_DN55946_c0_g1_i1.p1  ORF type:complete len:341 (+),score=67.65 TRINITY_DN55946_c0_g1_i1:159-1181(+)